MKKPGSGIRVSGFAFAALLLSLGASLVADATLVEAVKSGDAAAVKALLQAKADGNSAEADGTTALHWAVRRGDLATVDLLLKAGAKASTANRYGVTPLYLASANGDAVTVARLLDAGADPNTSLPDGETVLMTAARTGNVAVIKALVARGANVRARERRKGQDALMWAATENNAAAVTALIEAGADRDSRSNGGAFTPFLFAVRGGHLDSSRALLDAGVDGNQPLSDGTSPLVLAVMNAHYELAGLLLERGANPNADAQGWSALHQIAWSRRHNAGFNLPGPVQTGNLDSLELVRQLVKRGANVNARTTKEPRDGNRNMLNRLGSTAFLMAAKNDDVPMMRVLLEVGADPSLTTNRGTTALMVAAGVGIWAPGENPGTHEEALAAMKLALEVGGGDVNDVDMDGETALHGAVYRGGNITAIQFLIDKGAQLDVRNAKGWIPLTVADGVEYTPAVLKRYPEAAALLRKTMRDRGLPVPEGTHSPEVAPPAAQSTPPATRTIWDGVFTQAQADRGRDQYRKSCASCHKADLLGESAAPPLAGPEFSQRWVGSNIDDLLTTIRRSMPQDAPDSLGTPAYVDLVSYLLSVNGSQAGANDMPLESAGLKQIQFTAR
ncbi:MAG TPA: ankyrin repeat domain-containing protein [Vicinamibacterales bacterium]|nr:ankyrin repeat domain-containing protein [Vicinamibacterales bacterium]